MRTLLERDAELDTLRAVLADACEGRGGVVLVEAPPGQGKTSLLRALRDGAQVRVHSAAAAELERERPFGLIRQLFPEGGDLAAHVAAAGEPLLLLVDDAHWGDDGSLAALSRLARDIQSLPVALVIATRAVAGFSAATVLRPRPLSRAAVARLVADAVDGDVEPAFVAAAAEATGGNALLLRELCRTLAAEVYSGSAAELERVRHAAPGTIARLVQGRLWRLSPAAVAFARAVAALGDRATPATAHALAGLDASVASSAHTALAAVGILEPGALRFTHPLMREATLAGILPATRSQFHRRAAHLLLLAGADEQDVAAQFLAAEPESDPRAARLLLATGTHALEAGDAGVALRHLRRALRESQAAPSADLLLALGLAEARAGTPSASLWLRRAATVAERRVELAA